MQLPSRLCIPQFHQIVFSTYKTDECQLEGNVEERHNSHPEYGHKEHLKLGVTL